MKTLIDRLKDRCRIDPAGCWVWKQGLNRDGYPMIRFLSSSPTRVQRVMWVIAVGSVSERRVIVNTCGDSRCINPEHLRSVTKEDAARKNIAQANRKLNKAIRQAIYRRRTGEVATWHP